MHAKRICLMAAFIVTCTVATAQEAKQDDNKSVSTQGVATAGDLERIQAETIMLQAQLARAKAVDALANTGKTGQQAMAQQTATGPGAPVVSEVYGSGRNLKATFVYPDRSTITAVPGDRLPDGCTVKSVAIEQVRTVCHGQDTVVGFAGSATPRALSQSTMGPAATYIAPSQPAMQPIVPGMVQQ